MSVHLAVKSIVCDPNMIATIWHYCSQTIYIDTCFERNSIRFPSKITRVTVEYLTFTIFLTQVINRDREVNSWVAVFTKHKIWLVSRSWWNTFCSMICNYFCATNLFIKTIFVEPNEVLGIGVYTRWKVSKGLSSPHKKSILNSHYHHQLCCHGHSYHQLCCHFQLCCHHHCLICYSCQSSW